VLFADITEALDDSIERFVPGGLPELAVFLD